MNSECVGCGYCCSTAMCATGTRLYGNADSCPALIWDGTKNVCKLMQLPYTLGAIYRKEMDAGAGCCSGLNSWRNDPIIDRTRNTKELPCVPALMQKFIACLSRQWLTNDKIYLSLSLLRGTLVKDGMDKRAIDHIIAECYRYFNEQKSTINKDFIG